MKVVLFCGGLGTRLREHSETTPKPLVNIGARPVLWHLMRYYAHFGHTDFILCLGYRGDMIKDYFLHYDECLSNDFVLSGGGKHIEPLSTDIDNWTITFVDTGLHSNIGERLVKVRQFVDGEEMFLANYSDGLGDLRLDQHIDQFMTLGTVASFAATRITQSFHTLREEENGLVTSFGPLAGSDCWVNAGFFCLRPEIFDYIRDGEDLVATPFQRLIERRRLSVFRHHGFWQPMDTLREKILYDRLEARGHCPWMVWKD